MSKRNEDCNKLIQDGKRILSIEAQTSLLNWSLKGIKKGQIHKRLKSEIREFEDLDNTTSYALIVEDDPYTAEDYGAALSMNGYQVSFAYNSDEALKIVRHFGTKLALIVIDIRMPYGQFFDTNDTVCGHRTGVLLAGEIENCGYAPYAEIVALTNSNDSLNESWFRARNYKFCEKKLFSPEEFCSFLDKSYLSKNSTGIKVEKKMTRTKILLVTVNKNETTAVRSVFKNLTRQTPKFLPIDERVYCDLGVVNGTQIFHALSAMGANTRGGMQQTVEKGITAIKPDAVICIGIAFGVNEKKQEIGEILISEQLRLYTLAREGKDMTIPRGDKPHASTWLCNYFNHFAQTEWTTSKVTSGVILTGGVLVDNIDYRTQLIKLEPEAIGGEMEGAGAYISCEEKRVHWIVIKAICDWGDGKKKVDKEVRQKKAANQAANFVAAALEHIPLTCS